MLLEVLRVEVDETEVKEDALSTWSIQWSALSTFDFDKTACRESCLHSTLVGRSSPTTKGRAFESMEPISEAGTEMLHKEDAFHSPPSCTSDVPTDVLLRTK